MQESEYIHKSHNVSVLLYHFVCPAKYRKVVFSKAVDQTLKEICIEIEKRYEVHFLEIGTDKDHVHFLVQWVPIYSPKRIIQIIKSVTARELFVRHPEIKKQLRWWELRSKWYYVNTVGKYSNEEVIRAYVRNQWLGWYKKLYASPYKEQSLFGV